MLAIATLALQGVAHGEAPPASAVERAIPAPVQPSTYGPLVIVSRPTVSPNSANKPFTLSAINIDGATVFSQRQLSKHFEAYLATTVDEVKLGQIAQAITRQYQHKGYILSYASVPEQSVEAGMVRLQVVEGRVGSILVEGAGPATAALKSIAAPLARERVLRRSTLERTLGLMRDFRGLKLVDVALVQSDAQAGLYTLKVVVAPDRVRAFVYADNRGIAGVGRVRLFSSVAVSSVLLAGDDFRAELFGVPGDHSHYDFGQLSAAAPISDNGLRFAFTASRGNQYLRSAERFTGRSDNLAAELSYPFRRSRDLSVFGTLSFNDSVAEGTVNGARKLHDHLRALRIGISFVGEDRAPFRADLVFSKGLPFAGATTAADPLASRPGASGKFSKISASLEISHPLTQQLTLRGTAIAQYADRPLLAAEEISLGGSRVGRAFEFNALTGTRGAGAGVELGYRLSTAKDKSAGTELFAFADGGFVSTVQTRGMQTSHEHLGSIGTGLRFRIRKMSVGLEAGVPLSGRHSPRLFATLFQAF